MRYIRKGSLALALALEEVFNKDLRFGFATIKATRRV